MQVPALQNILHRWNDCSCVSCHFWKNSASIRNSARTSVCLLTTLLSTLCLRAILTCRIYHSLGHRILTNCRAISFIIITKGCLFRHAFINPASWVSKKKNKKPLSPSSSVWVMGQDWKRESSRRVSPMVSKSSKYLMFCLENISAGRFMMFYL